MKFVFGDIVVVYNYEIGVVVKSWEDGTHEVYVRNYNSIQRFKENEMERYLVRHKYLSEEEMEYQSNAIKIGEDIRIRQIKRDQADCQADAGNVCVNAGVTCFVCNSL